MGCANAYCATLNYHTDMSVLNFIKLTDAVSRSINSLPNKIAAEAVAFSKERFTAQKWVDKTTEVWEPRKTERKSKRRNSGAILVDSGRLKRSIRKISVSHEKIVIGTDVPYARIHNDGFKGMQSVRGHRRRGHEVKAFNRNMDMPRRRFLGSSAVLNNRLQRLITAEIKTAIKSVIK